MSDILKMLSDYPTIEELIEYCRARGIETHYTDHFDSDGIPMRYYLSRDQLFINIFQDRIDNPEPKKVAECEEDTDS